MPFLEQPSARRTTPHLSAHGSLAVELEWALCAAVRADWRADSAALTAAYAADPGLEDEVGSLWEPDEATTCGGFMELTIVAEHAGLLFSTDEHRLLDPLEEHCARAPTDFVAYPAMRSEEAEDQRAVLRRLARLHGSADFRARYASAVRRTWAAVRDDWERHGRHVVAHAVEQRRRLIARGADWREVTRGDCDHADLLARSLELQGPGAAVVVVPAYFTHFGLLVDYPGIVLVGVRPDSTAVDARARTEAVARGMKALADPTRLAILDALQRTPRSITELAGLFGLSQPTVSNHVKVLRGVGLVTDQRHDGRRALVVQAGEAQQLLAALGQLLAVEAPASPSS